MSVVVQCRKCGEMMGTWGGIFPPTYDLSNKEMGFPEECMKCLVEALDMDLVGKSNKKRFHVDGLIDSHLPRKELIDKLDELGFYHFKCDEVDPKKPINK